MNATDVRDAVQEQKATELSRLGSSKSLYAATGGEMESDAVLAAAADASRAAAAVFEAWADDEDDDQAREAFETTAAEAADHAETAAAELEDYQADESESPLGAHLREIDGTVPRAGAVLGHVLVADARASQYVGFFVGNADPQTASVFREVRDGLDAQEGRALELLDSVCESDDDWDTAQAAALQAVTVAYEGHVQQLEDLGVDPKPVC
ncbi:rubrerythrin family protein [Salinarchaeum laminariae]|uniref:rubrerythrin family protein n=1 Tax=Salinarchaeum laminariae TaxID=869888 RepID=UPI0020BD5D89|nr:rubrerythrin family protein [Salinarchaeum laminariae]